MIFMRTVGTNKVRLRQVKTYHTDLSVTSLWMAVNGIHDPQICPNTKLKHSFMMTSMTHLTCTLEGKAKQRLLLRVIALI